MAERPIPPLGQKTGYRVRLAVFEGPLDLLLQLIEREELDITRVSLALVADQYLEYLSALDELQVDDLTDFIVVAARLILIKSQSLLPRPPTAVQIEGEDAGEDLVRQLLAYKQFKEAAKLLEERQRQGKRSYVRVAPLPNIEMGTQHLEAVPLESLVAAARRAMQMRPAAPPVDGVIPSITITINEQIDRITQTLNQRSRLAFTELLSAAHTRHEVIVTLMALLELIKRQQIQARQDRIFGEIEITPLT